MKVFAKAAKRQATFKSNLRALHLFELKHGLVAFFSKSLVAMNVFLSESHGVCNSSHRRHRKKELVACGNFDSHKTCDKKKSKETTLRR